MNVLEFIQQGAPWHAIYISFMIAFILFDIVLIGVLVWVVRKSIEFRPRFDHTSTTDFGEEVLVYYDRKVRNQWYALRQALGKTQAHSPVRTVIAADAFVDEILRRDLKLKGEHIADRLEQLNSFSFQPKVLENLLRAHRVANELKKAPDFDLSLVDTNEVLDFYEAFLFATGILEE